jgi:hypothetical protein
MRSFKEIICIELRQRTDDLSESLEQQTATSEVLQVISSSPGELKPVFEAMLESATQICEASYGVLWLKEGEAFRNVALHGAMPAAFTQGLCLQSPNIPLPMADLSKDSGLHHTRERDSTVGSRRLGRSPRSCNCPNTLHRISDAQTSQLLATAGIFAVGFFMRPLGGGCSVGWRTRMAVGPRW